MFYGENLEIGERVSVDGDWLGIVTRLDVKDVHSSTFGSEPAASVKPDDPEVGRARPVALRSIRRLTEEDPGPAIHSDPAINALYRARRAAAVSADGSGWSATAGWRNLEQIENELRKLDPAGDWRYEGDRYDGRGWQVRRPVEAV